MRTKHDEHRFRVTVGAEPADRPIAVPRADLLVSPQMYYGQLCFVVKDPVTLRYYRLQPVEHFLFTQLDGRRTARDLVTILQQRFPETPLSLHDMLRFVGMLHEAHLLTGEGAGHAAWLARQARTSRRRRWLQAAQNFLFVKLPLFNPERLLTIMDAALGRIIFNRYTGYGAIALILAALWLVLSRADRLADLPYNLLSLQNLAIVYLVFIIAKVFHEFGHGLTAKHFGGEISQMGVMLYVFTPSFYCDTSDAWMIPSRPARLWINAGGICVELVIAALASFVWAFTQPTTLVSQVALNVMIACSVATLVFNANPLLRYDGYYFLADLLEIPNLMTKGQEFLKYHLQKKLLDLNPPEPPDGQRLVALSIFAVLSTIYRWIVTFAIISLLCYFLDRYGLGPLGVFVALIYVGMSLFWPLGRGVAFLWKQRWELRKRLAYVGGALGVGAAVLLMIALFPWSHTLREPLVILAAHDEPIYVRTPGYINAVDVQVGDHVSKGQILAQLRDPQLASLLASANAGLQRAGIQLAKARSENQPAAVAAAQSAVDAYTKQISLLNDRIADLTLRAPITGVIMNDTPLGRVKGDYLGPGTLVCRVLSAGNLEARISLPQQTAALVKPGMNVKIRLWSDPDSLVRATVTRVSAEVSDKLLHPALSSADHGDVAVTADQQGDLKTVGRRSIVVIDLPGTGEWLADGMTGRGEIVVAHSTVAGRLWRMILDTTTPDWHL